MLNWLKTKYLIHFQNVSPNKQAHVHKAIVKWLLKKNRKNLAMPIVDIPACPNCILCAEAAPGWRVKQNHSCWLSCLRNIDNETKKITVYCDYPYFHLVNCKSGKLKQIMNSKEFVTFCMVPCSKQHLDKARFAQEGIFSHSIYLPDKFY